MITYILLFLVILIILCLAISNKRKTIEGIHEGRSWHSRKGGSNAGPQLISSTRYETLLSKNEANINNGFTYTLKFNMTVQDQGWGGTTVFSVIHYDKSGKEIKRISHGRDPGRKAQNKSYEFKDFDREHSIKLYAHRTTYGHWIQRISKPSFQYMNPVKKPPVDCQGEFEPCDSNCKKKWKITRPAANGGNECNDGGEVIRDGDERNCEPGDDNNDECKRVDCEGTWGQVGTDPCKIKFSITTAAAHGGTCPNEEGYEISLYPGEKRHNFTCPTIGECEPADDAQQCGGASNGEQLILYSHPGGKLDYCTAKENYPLGNYCYKQSILINKARQNQTREDLENNLSDVTCITDGYTYDASQNRCVEGFSNFLKRKGNALEGFSNADALKKKQGDSEVVSSKEFIDYLIELLEVPISRINSDEQRELEAGTSLEARENSNEWTAMKYESYKNVLGRFYDFTKPKNNRVNTALLRDIIFNLEYEKKFIEFLDRLSDYYTEYNSIEQDDEKRLKIITIDSNGEERSTPGPVRKEIDLTILALKIFKWKISKEYVKYFLNADIQINKGETFEDDFLPANISFTDLVNEKNQSSDKDLNDLRSICNNLVANEKDFFMKKLNKELFDNYTDNPTNDISDYVKTKANKARDDNLSECRTMCNINRNSNVAFNGCNQKSFFQREIDFILQAPNNNQQLNKLLIGYKVFVFSTKDEKINFTTKLEKISYNSPDHKQFNGTASYIKDLSGNVKADNPMFVGFIFESPNSNTDLTLPYERPRWPLWGLEDIQYNRFQKEITTTSSSEGFTTLKNIRKRKFAQNIRRVKNNPIHDVISFFKRNIFGKNYKESFNGPTAFEQTNNVEFHLKANGESNPVSLSNNINKLEITYDGDKKYLWYFHIFPAATQNTNRDFLNAMMTKISDDNSNIYKYNNVSGVNSKIVTSANTYKKDLFGIEEDAEWDNAIIHLYTNDDG